MLLVTLFETQEGFQVTYLFPSVCAIILTPLISLLLVATGWLLELKHSHFIQLAFLLLTDFHVLGAISLN